MSDSSELQRRIGGDVWLHQHVAKAYTPCWQEPLANGGMDAALCDIGFPFVTTPDIAIGLDVVRDWLGVRDAQPDERLEQQAGDVVVVAAHKDQPGREARAPAALPLRRLPRPPPPFFFYLFCYLGVVLFFRTCWCFFL